eukprot:scaffold388_cov380-Prasinococcus_capsulatus_cf.AAC.11
MVSANLWDPWEPYPVSPSWPDRTAPAAGALAERRSPSRPTPGQGREGVGGHGSSCKWAGARHRAESQIERDCMGLRVLEGLRAPPSGLGAARAREERGGAATGRPPGAGARV